MIVSTCGFGSTGSSAVSDYLMECDNTQVMDKVEFTLTSCVDGLCDLEYHLMKQHARQHEGITAIQRFQARIKSFEKRWKKRTGITYKSIEQFTEEFLDRITQVKYIGMSPRIYKGGNKFVNEKFGDAILLRRIIKPLEKKKVIKKDYYGYPFGEVRLSIHPADFYVAAQEYVKNILSGMGADFNKMIVLDQAFSGVDPAASFPFYEDPYAIVVDRDPRDMYIFAKKVLLTTGRFMPTDTVENFITYYKLLRDNQPYKQPNERCLLVRFEEMVYDYENTVNRIDKFLNVTNTRRKTVFVPEMSAANTNLVKKFPEFAEDVEKIEKELKEYLFDFDKYPSVKDSGTMFFGKSPLNNT